MTVTGTNFESSPLLLIPGSLQCYFNHDLQLFWPKLKAYRWGTRQDWLARGRGGCFEGFFQSRSCLFMLIYTDMSSSNPGKVQLKSSYCLIAHAALRLHAGLRLICDARFKRTLSKR